MCSPIQNNLLLWAEVISISISVMLLIWLLDKFILSKLMAAIVEPRIKSREIEQLMPPVIIRISDKSNGITSTDGGGGGNQCVICLEEFKDGEWCRVFPQCNHEFHVPCIDAWLRRPNLTCPVCRHSLKDDGASPNVAGDDLV
jgi:hypothetical protein